MMSSKNNNGIHQKKPDNIIWIEEVILNNLEENGIPGAIIESVQNHETDTPSLKQSLSKSSGDQVNINEEDSNSSHTRSKSKELSTAVSSNADPNSQLSIESNLPPTQNQSDIRIGIAEIELKDESYLGDERVQTLSRIVTGKIKYFIQNNRDYEDEERFQYWIIKLPSLMNPSRSLSQQMDVARREIAFYTEILPGLKAWIESHSLSNIIEFRVPTCFYGKYLRPIDSEPELDIITHILDSESLLVLDDLRTYGFGKRHFANGLLISEVISALEEIVKFHVVSWAMQQLDDKSSIKWPHLYDWENIAYLYYSLLETQFSNVEKFLHDSKHPKARAIYMRLLKIRPQLLNRLFNLLEPADYPLVNTLIHMDFWSENIMYRMTEQDKDDQVPLEEANIDCCILDWQLVSFGKPTHDIAQLVMLSMEPSHRREHANFILQFYHQLFEKTAGYFGLEMPFDFQTLKQEYKQSCVLATFMAMASIEIVQMEETTQNRLLEALADIMDEKLL